jgi:hypothetical protein
MLTPVNFSVHFLLTSTFHTIPNIYSRCQKQKVTYTMPVKCCHYMAHMIHTYLYLGSGPSFTSKLLN